MSDFSDPRWMTFQQAKSEGLSIKKGSKGTPIQVFKYQTEKVLRDENNKPVKDQNGDSVTTKVQLDRPIIRSFTVFNAEQIQGIPPLEPVKLTEWEVAERAERILAGSQAKIDHKFGDRAYYSPSQDKIVLPLKEQFPSAEKYYATALHELGHWTGHSDRLDRPMTGSFGTPDYAKEELRAEIASMMLSQTIGTSHDPNQHLSYVSSWIKVLENDPMEIMHATRDAEKIHDYVLEREQEIDKTAGLTNEELKTDYEKKLTEVPDSLATDAKKLEQGMKLVLSTLPPKVQEEAQRNFYVNQLSLFDQATQDQKQVDPTPEKNDSLDIELE